MKQTYVYKKKYIAYGIMSNCSIFDIHLVKRIKLVTEM